MARLHRPHVPLSVRCQVAERQLNAEEPFRGNLPARFGARLRFLLDHLARKFGCELKDLRLDHDPALGVRPLVHRGRGKPPGYSPDANDPEHLVYRPHGVEFEGSHDVKTRIRGDHGQYSDIVLIKRERRREKKAHKREHKPRPVWAKRGKLSTKGRSRVPKVKPSWPKRSFPKRKKS